MPGKICGLDSCSMTSLGLCAAERAAEASGGALVGDLIAEHFWFVAQQVREGFFPPSLPLETGPL